MRKFIRTTVATIALFASCIALAVEPAAPFGMELGKATYAQVQATLGAKTHFEFIEQNAVTDGHTLISRGDGLAMPDLRKATFGFDADGVLQIVFLDLPKGGMRNEGFRHYLGLLKNRYRLVKSKQPFVGDQYAMLAANNAEVTVAAPHMSFTLTIVYVTPAGRAALDAYEAAKKAKRHAAEAGSL